MKISARIATCVAVVATLLALALPASAVTGQDIIDTYAGNGTWSGTPTGDGGPALEATLEPEQLAAAPDGSPWAGSLFFTQDDIVRRIAPDGTISRFAGGGVGYTEGELAIEADLDEGYRLSGIDVARDGTVYVIGLYGPDTIYRIAPEGTVHLHAKSTDLWQSEGLVVASNGDLYVASTHNYTIQRVSPDGTVTKVYGTPGRSSCNAGELGAPVDVALSPEEDILYIADYGVNTTWALPLNNHDGRTPVYGLCTGGVRFTSAVEVDATGRVYVTNGVNHQVLLADGSVNGVVVAGTGTSGFSGDGGPAAQAQLWFGGNGLAAGNNGELFISDYGNKRIRRISPTVPPLAGLSISDAMVAEGDKGSRVASFTVSLPAALDSDVTVNWATADDTAVAGSPGDFVAKSGSVTIPAGKRFATVSVPVKGDNAVEPDETFFVNLSGASVPVAKATGVGTVEDDDGPRLAVSDVTVVEGDSGTRAAEFTVSLSTAAAQDVSVAYETHDGSAVAPGDYAAKSGTLTFAAGQRSKVVSVPVKGNTVNEADETFSLYLSGQVPVPVLDGDGRATIVNDDAVAATGASVSVSDVAVSEGDTGVRMAYFTVSLSDALTSSVTVDYATADGTAAAPGDYAAKSGSLTFAAGQRSKRVAVAVKGNRANEGDEAFTLNLSGASGAAVADGSGTATIVNDDGALLAVSDVTIAEGHDGIRTASYTISLSTPAAAPVTVNYETLDLGSASAPGDFAAKAPTAVTIDAGKVSRTVTVAIKGDTTDEPNEYFGVLLTDGSVPVAREFGLAFILDDDPTPTTTS